MQLREKLAGHWAAAARYGKVHRVYLAVVVGYFACVIALYAANPFALQALRFIAFDSYQRIAPRAYNPDLPVRIVDIDERSLAALGQWPWPRTVLADLVDKLHADGAAVVAFDAMFPETDRSSPEQLIDRLPSNAAALLRDQSKNWTSNDDVFAHALMGANAVLAVTLTNDVADKAAIPSKAGMAVAGDDPKAFLYGFPRAIDNLPALDMAAAGLGSINWIPDRDGVVRRVPLVFRLNDQIVPSIASEALRLAQGAPSYLLKSSNANGETAYGRATGMNHIRIGMLEAPTDADGAIWLRFRPSAPERFLSAADVIAGRADPEQIRGRIVLIGTSAAGLVDLRATPLGDVMPGVEIHAQLIEHLVSGDVLTRPDYAGALELFVLLLCGGTLALFLPVRSASTAAMLGAGVLALFFAAGWTTFRYAGLLFDPVFPSAVIFFQIAATALHSYRLTAKKRDDVQRTFGQYVSPHVVKSLIDNPEKVVLGGEVRELTLMFSDVKNFTTMSEGLKAEELTRLLNELLTPMTDLIMDSGGTIDKYMGDGIMAFWNAPLDDPDHARHACEAAIAMRKKIRELNVHWRERAEREGTRYRPLDIGIGINSGPCCVGNLGSSRKFDYSAIGDDVNVTSRFESLTRLYNVPAIVGEQTVARVTNLDFLEVDILRVKGRTGVSRIYTPTHLLNIENGGFEPLRQRHGAFLAAYRHGDWQGAAIALDICRQCRIADLESLYTVYEERIARMAAGPIPPDWDGVYTAKEK